MILGLVAAKENSNRFPGKNYHEYRGKPMFWHSVKPLLESKLIDDVFVITDSKKIQDYCIDHGVKVIWRPRNASKDSDKLITILRWAYYSLDNEYDTVVAIMANCPGHTSETVDLAIKRIKNERQLTLQLLNHTIVQIK